MKCPEIWKRHWAHLAQRFSVSQTHAICFRVFVEGRLQTSSLVLEPERRTNEPETKERACAGRGYENEMGQHSTLNSVFVFFDCPDSTLFLQIWRKRG